MRVYRYVLASGMSGNDDIINIELTVNAHQSNGMPTTKYHRIHQPIYYSLILVVIHLPLSDLLLLNRVDY